MIITNLIGGLGNQMFQLAAGLSLAKKHNTSLLLDIHEFDQYQLRDFELNQVFTLPYRIAEPREFKFFLWHKKFPFTKLPSSISPKINRALKIHYFKEPHTHFYKGFYDLPNNCYLWGFWNSEKYFRNVSQEIKKIFQFKKSANARIAEINKQIRTQQSVAVHIRRGDYASSPKTTKVHGLCSIDYYLAATQIFKKLLNKPIYFIFSDDIPWCKKNIRIKPVIFVEHNGKNSDDLQLMTSCKHQIVANSTFSWWSAWLNNNPTKMVVAPRPWFNDPSFNDKDICPKNWISIGK